MEAEDIRAFEALANMEDLDSQIVMWNILKRRCKSLVTPKPTKGSTRNVWTLEYSNPSCSEDRAFIHSHAGHHKINLVRGHVFLQ